MITVLWEDSRGTAAKSFGPHELLLACVADDLDRDQLHDLWPTPSPSCRSGITARFRQDAEGDYDLVLLERNMETLIEITCQILGRHVPPKDPDERDRVLLTAVWPPSGTTDIRQTIRHSCPSFARIVARVAGHMTSTHRPGRGWPPALHQPP